MSAAIRLTAVLALIAASAPCAFAQLPTAPPPHLALDELVKEYKRFGLPLPPKSAELVRLTEKGMTPRLAWRIPPVKPGGEPKYLSGTEYVSLWYRPPVVFEVVKLTLEALQGVHVSWSSDLMALAVQCRVRGWNELAALLNREAGVAINGRKVMVTERSFGGFNGLPAGTWRSSSVSGLRSKDLNYRSVVEELRLAASAYWMKRVMDAESDRREVLRYLKIVEPDDNALIRDLEITLAPRTSKPGTVAALVDDLTDYASKMGDGPDLRENSSYRTLAELGFDAVPELMKHLDDERLTRSTGSKPMPAFRPFGGYEFRSYAIRVNTLVSWILDDLSGGEIGHRTLHDKIADQDKLRKWWAKAQQVGEEKWLLEHALPREDPPWGGRAHTFNDKSYPGPNEVILYALGAKYPNRLAEVFETVLRKRPNLDIDLLAQAVVASKLPRERKIALLQAGATHKNLVLRIAALKALVLVDEAKFQKHLLATLKSFPNTLDDFEYWQLWPFEGLQVAKLVERANTAECWDGLAATARRVSVDMRQVLLKQISTDGVSKDRRLRLEQVRFLSGFLNDRSTSLPAPPPRDPGDLGSSYTYNPEVCDVAADQLVCLLRLDIEPDQFRGSFYRFLIRAAVAELARKELAVAPGKDK